MSNIPNDGDPVRALGFLVLYSGNLEGAIKEELERIQRAQIVPVNPTAKTLGGKIGELRKFEAEYAANHPKGAENELHVITDVLNALKDFTQTDRNPLVHGSITGESGSKGLTLTDNTTGARRAITSEEIYDAANFAFELIKGVMALRYVLKDHLRARGIKCDFEGNRT